MGSLGSTGLGGAAFFLTVVTTVTTGDAAFAFLSGGCAEEEVDGDDVDAAEVVRVPLLVDLVVDDDVEAGGALPPKKLIMMCESLGYAEVVLCDSVGLAPLTSGCAYAIEAIEAV